MDPEVLKARLLAAGCQIITEESLTAKIEVKGPEEKELPSLVNRDISGKKSLTKAAKARIAEFHRATSCYVFRRNEPGAPPVPKDTPARPGDVIVDRALRAAYGIAPDGSRRRLDKEQTTNLVKLVKERLNAPTVAA